jgi:predicted O-methyltransferase YrrM
MTPEHGPEIAFLANLAKAEGVRSFLEIGARSGVSFGRIAEALDSPSKVVAVDLPGGPWGSPDTDRSLRDTAGRLTTKGHDVDLVLGDSRDPGIVAQVERSMPFDLLYIDADHAYESVKADWENYGPMAAMVAFDDIWSRDRDIGGGAVLACGVPRLWREIRQGHRYLEIAGTENRTHGIGLIWQS